MALAKTTFVDHEGYIGAAFLNALQDEIIDKCVTVEYKAFTDSQKKLARQSIGVPTSDTTIEEGSTVALSDLTATVTHLEDGTELGLDDNYFLNPNNVRGIPDAALDIHTDQTRQDGQMIDPQPIDFDLDYYFTHAGGVYVPTGSSITYNSQTVSVCGALMCITDSQHLHSDQTSYVVDMAIQVIFDKLTDSIYMRFKVAGVTTSWVKK